MYLRVTLNNRVNGRAVARRKSWKYTKPNFRAFNYDHKHKIKPLNLHYRNEIIYFISIDFDLNIGKSGYAVSVLATLNRKLPNKSSRCRYLIRREISGFGYLQRTLLVASWTAGQTLFLFQLLMDCRLCKRLSRLTVSTSINRGFRWIWTHWTKCVLSR